MTAREAAGGRRVEDVRSGGGPDDATVLNWFRYHPATPVTGPVHEWVRGRFRTLAGDLLESLPPGPDRTLAMRKLQEAMMAANACVANTQGEDPPGG